MQSIHLINFQCFAEAHFSLRPLTFLSGLNSSGKTALLQSLLLLVQSYQSKILPSQGLLLNGPLASVGSVGELLRMSAPEDAVMSIAVEIGSSLTTWEFSTWNRQLDVYPGKSPRKLPAKSPLPQIHHLRSCAIGRRVDFKLLEAANPGSLILIEHPEFGLHGSAVTTVANRIATAVARGVQVMVESHSDHLLNGIRIAIHQGRLKPEAFNCLHFDFAKGDQRSVVVKEVVFDRHGRSNTWPEHFFDEWEKTLDQLLGPIKPN